MKIKHKKWLIYASVACGLIYAALSFANLGLSEEMAKKVIENALAKSRGVLLISRLPLTSTSAVAVLQVANASDENIQRIIRDLDGSIKLPDVGFNNFVAHLDSLNRTHDNSRYGTIPEKGILETYRAIWKTGLIDRFNWVSGRNSFGAVEINGSAIPKPQLRSKCIAYNEGDTSCNFIAATVTLNEVTGIVGNDEEKRVEFTVHIEPTEQEIEFRSLWPSMDGHSGRSWNAFDAHPVAIFVHYDDGWRLKDWNLTGLLASMPF